MNSSSQGEGLLPVFSADGANDRDGVGAMIQALDGRETVADDQSQFSWQEGFGDRGEARPGQNMLNLLYHIAEDQARKDGYIHRGVECNGCGVCPIQGIRYRCANCLDFDLCENCEAMQVHIKTHIFYKIRIPPPSLGYPKQPLPLWYPGKPASLPRSLPRELSRRLLKETSLDNPELEALWDQFRCLAGYRWLNDPNKLGMAIDRKIFDKCFVPPTSLRSPPPNLIYDRMFAFYDTNNDGVIGFEEFLKGLANLQDKTRDAKLRRIFRGYDMDDDGLVDRKDFLRMFRAYYSLCKELNREMIAGVEEDFLEGAVREVIQSSQPISSAFPGSIPPGHASRGGSGKEPDVNGDLTITDDRGVLEEDFEETKDRHKAIGDAAIGSRPHGHPFRTFRPQPVTDDPLMIPNDPELTMITHVDDAEVDSEDEDLPIQMYGWPPINSVETEDVLNALGRDIPFEEIMDPVDRARIFFAQSQRIDAQADRHIEEVRNRAIQERWRRRSFYTDVEEGATAPPGYTEADSSDDEANGNDGLKSPDSLSDSRRPSLRSRSSSKVRFEDSITDTDYETRSNTSSRSIPVGERWGGFEISDIEKDVGKEVLFQAVQQGFNEMLDQLFKDKEDLAMEAAATLEDRHNWAAVVEERGKAPDNIQGSSSAGKPTSIDETSEDDQSEPDELPEDSHRSSTKIRTPVTSMSNDSVPTNDGVSAVNTQPSGGKFPSPERSRFKGDKVSSEDSFDFTPVKEVSFLVEESAHLPDLRPDPTLPQHRPSSTPPPAANTSSVIADPSSPSTPRATRIAALNSVTNLSTPSHPGRKSSLPNSRRLSCPLPPTARIAPPSPETLTLWAKHDRIDAEAKQRGGHGKLNFEEFADKMVDEDRASDALGTMKDKDYKWGNSASMGRLGFVGTWIDMASF